MRRDPAVLRICHRPGDGYALTLEPAHSHADVAETLEKLLNASASPWLPLSTYEGGVLKGTGYGFEGHELVTDLILAAPALQRSVRFMGMTSRIFDLMGCYEIIGHNGTLRIRVSDQDLSGFKREDNRTILFDGSYDEFRQWARTGGGATLRVVK